MNELTLSLRDYTGILDRSILKEKICTNAALLKQCVEGHEEYRDSLGWLTVNAWTGENQLLELEKMAERVRANAEVLVVVGIGGSNQAARAVLEALGGSGDIEIVWAGNTLSAHSMRFVLDKIAGKNFYINVIAKNFETLEPGITFRALRTLMIEKYGSAYNQRVICTGTIGSALHELCKEQGYHFLPFPTDIGGRYSSLSPVSLFPLATAGINIRAIVEGAKHMEELLKTLPAMENPALQYAVVRNELYSMGLRMEMLAFFEPRFFRFSRWWMQLFGESEGKNDRGLYPICGNYSEDLHSIGQFVQEGTPIIFETFLSLRSPDSSVPVYHQQINDGFDYLDNKDFAQVNVAAEAATLEAHSGRFPCLVLEVERFDEYSFGQLFYFFQFSCYLSAQLLGVNPFNQPGVEAYKQEMFEKLGKYANK